MPREVVKKFEVAFLRILDEDGNCDELLKPDLSDIQVKEIFELMILARTFDESL